MIQKKSSLCISLISNKQALLKIRNVLLILIIFTGIGCETDLDNTENNIIFEKKMVSDTPRVLVNGVPLNFGEQQPEVVRAVVMVPVVEVLKRLGYTSSYNRWTRTLVSTNESSKIVIKVGRLRTTVDGKRIDQSRPPYFSNGVLMIDSTLFSNLETTLAEYDEETKSLQLYYYDELDYGLYFYDNQLSSNESDAVGSQKFVSGQDNPFYDPTKPTIIWVHGWQNGGVQNKFKNNFHLKNDEVDTYVHNEWIEQGWNVAVFNWVALADELLPYDAESKINSATTNGVGMRWKKADGSYVTNNTPTESVAELFAKAYEILAESQIHPTIRLAGSSFGGQVVLHGAEIIKEKGVSPLPSRIALLDIAWTRNYVSSQNLMTNKITVRAAKALSSKVLIEYYRSSILSTALMPRELADESAFQQMIFSYSGGLGIELKHTAITEHYFWSLQYDTPPAFNENDVIIGAGLSASTDDSTLRAMMGPRFQWKHKAGRDTFDPKDDTFERLNGF